MRNTRPRTFKEVVAAKDPAEMARLERGDRFVDPSVNAFHGEVWVNEDRFGTGEWRVEYFDDDGGCYVTIFAGPAAERRARDYFNSLKSGRLSIKREPPRSSPACDGWIDCRDLGQVFEHEGPLPQPVEERRKIAIRSDTNHRVPRGHYS